MKDDWQRLTKYLLDRLPEGIAYDDLVQLCLGLHSYIDGIPADLQPLLNKEGQAKAFAAFVRTRFDENYGATDSAKYGANHHRPIDKGHWIEVMASIYKAGTSFDSEREREIRQRLTAHNGVHDSFDPRRVSAL